MDYTKHLARPGLTPWCMGMGDPPSSGWPGSDLIEDLILRGSGLSAYERWASGQSPWTSTEVTQAWRQWGGMVGDPYRALVTDFADAGRPMFDNPPRCALEHQASFLIGFYQRYENGAGKTLRPGADFDFFAFPARDPTDSPMEISVDLAAMFTSSPQAQLLVKFLATPEAQRIWGHYDNGAFSLNTNIDPAAYDNGVSQRIEKILAGSGELCLDAGDFMPQRMRESFYSGVLEYLNRRDARSLDTILAALENARVESRRTDLWPDKACSAG
jgi:alpha-glucoside transport system substrate-binding protein